MFLRNVCILLQITVSQPRRPCILILVLYQNLRVPFFHITFFCVYKIRSVASKEQWQENWTGICGLFSCAPNILSRSMLLYGSQATLNEKEKNHWSTGSFYAVSLPWTTFVALYRCMESLKEERISIEDLPPTKHIRLHPSVLQVWAIQSETAFQLVCLIKARSEDLIGCFLGAVS